jgi:hypothetical protein
MAFFEKFHKLANLSSLSLNE